MTTAVQRSPWMHNFNKVANISWRYKSTSGVIKCEIWDIVDKGISQQKKHARPAYGSVVR